MGLPGTISTTAPTPDFKNLRPSSSFFPERWSIFPFSSANLQAMWAVWQPSTGAYPALIWPGWFKIITRAVKPAASIGGSFLLSPATLPWQTSLTDTFLTLKPTLSPGRAELNASWFISTEFTSVVTLTGAKVTTMPGLRTRLHATHRDSTNTTDFTAILERQVQGFVSWASWWQDATQSFKQGGSTGIAVLTGDFPLLEPWHVSTWLQHVVTIPARNWHKCYCVGVAASFINVGADFLNNFLVSLLAVGWLSGIPFCELPQFVVSHAECKPEGHAHGSARSWRYRLQIHQRQQQQSG